MIDDDDDDWRRRLKKQACTAVSIIRALVHYELDDDALEVSRVYTKEAY